MLLVLSVFLVAMVTEETPDNKDLADAYNKYDDSLADGPKLDPFIEVLCKWAALGFS